MRGTTAFVGQAFRNCLKTPPTSLICSSTGRLESLPHDSFKSSRLSSPHPQVNGYRKSVFSLQFIGNCGKVLRKICRMGAEDMKNPGKCTRVCCLLVIIFLFSLSSVHSQNLLGDTDQIKRELGELRNEVQDLRDMLRSLKRALVDSATRPSPQSSENQPPTVAPVPPTGQKPDPQKAAVDEVQLTAIICPAVGKFLREAEEIIRENDSSTAEEKMDKAFQTLNATLRPYKATHRADKLLGIYEGLAWDTYVAVNMRHSVQGNQEFLTALAKHKRKYLDTCPQE
jgi:hypothetical protein